MVIFYNKSEKYNEIQLTRNKMDFNSRKITKCNHPPSPRSRLAVNVYFHFFFRNALDKDLLNFIVFLTTQTNLSKLFSNC